MYINTHIQCKHIHTILSILVYFLHIQLFSLDIIYMYMHIYRYMYIYRHIYNYIYTYRQCNYDTLKKKNKHALLFLRLLFSVGPPEWLQPTAATGMAAPGRLTI